MSEWCQNKKCPEKRTQGQIRGTKGNKYYQSNKASGYYDYWCSMGCREQWWNEHKTTCINAVGFIDKQILPLDDAWYVEYQYNWNNDTQEHDPSYYLRNKNMGVRQLITRQQAQSQEDIERDYCHVTIDDSQARELAVELGLAKAS
tara:strand:+ start:4126 stop:4563 length:438 start_codon:yes stop_codon:yes gene_type:complete